MNLKDKLFETLFKRYMRWRIDALLAPEYPVVLEYPIDPRPRWGEDKPPHAGLADICDRGVENYRANLSDLAVHKEQMAKIPLQATSPGEPQWDNTYFSAMDAIALYGILASRNPARYVEIGSGHSTRFARKAVRDFDLRTRITSIDPVPRAEVNDICDEVIRQPLESTDLEVMSKLGANDVLFLDSSHRVFTNSDVTVFFLEVLPRLRPGVLVHVHDIFLPYDYPSHWSKRHYSEQYLLAAFLLAACPWLEVFLPNAYVSRHPALSSSIEGLWLDSVFQWSFAHYRKLTGSYIGTSFWLRIGQRAAS